MALIENLAGAPEYDAIFADAALLQAMLDFEAALARAEASAGVIPAAAARAIGKAAKAERFNAKSLGAQGLRAGTLSIPLVKALRDRVRAIDAKSSRFVHWGATSQDVSDTAIVLLLQRAHATLRADCGALLQDLRRASGKYAGTVMLGRTLLQAAPPVTLGLKIAGWHGAIRRGWVRLDAALTDAAVLQFGGAAGTLAALGKQALPVTRKLAKELKLALPEAPWHAHRDRAAAVIGACGILTGSLAKMAKDVSLLMQNEVGEAAEPGGNGRGGSSAMPHKRNPIACALAISAGIRVPGYVATFLSAMPQEHERGLGGWHAEAATIARTISDTGLALVSVREVAAGLSVNAARMQENISETHGAIFAERAMILLGTRLGRDAADKILKDALQQTEKTGRPLAEALATIPEAVAILSSAELRSLNDPKAYLGAAEAFRQALLAARD
jgi:3-carboxy-cis,cis-muconate cycloisomerase